MKLPASLLLSFLLFTLFSCKGQSQQSTNSGQNTPPKIGREVDSLDQEIWRIFQDSDMNYWFGGNGSGVFRFDGTTLTQFTTEDGLVSNGIRGIQEDAAGNLFFDTPTGVSKFDGAAFQTLKIDYSNENDWQLNPEDLWFHGNGEIPGGLRYDGQKLHFLRLPTFDLQKAYERPINEEPINPYGTYSISKDEAGNLWFGTLMAGVCRYDGNSHLWITEQELSILEDGRVPAVRSVVEDQDGHFWLSNLLHRYQIHSPASGPVQKPYTQLPGIEQEAIKKGFSFTYFVSGFRYKNDELWFASYNFGVWIYDGKKLNQVPFLASGENPLILSLYLDRSEKIWAATRNSGVFEYNGEAFVKFNL